MGTWLRFRPWNLCCQGASVRGALVYKKNALKFEKNPLQGEDGEMDLQITAFPIDDDIDLTHQRQALREVRRALQTLVGKVDSLAEDDLLDERA